MRFNLTQDQFLSRSTKILLGYIVQKSVLIHDEGGFILLPWFKFQHNCPDNGRKKAVAPRRASSDTLIKGDQVVALLFVITKVLLIFMMRQICCCNIDANDEIEDDALGVHCAAELDRSDFRNLLWEWVGDPDYVQPHTRDESKYQNG